MDNLLEYIAQCIHLYKWVFIFDAILSWLFFANILNTGSRAVNLIGTALQRLTLPVLRPIRRHMPDLGGIDISPVIAILGCIFVANVVVRGFLMDLSG